LDEVFSDFARQFRFRLLKRSICHEDDVTRLQLPTPESIAASLQHTGEPMTGEAHLLVQRLANVGAEISDFGSNKGNRVAGKIDSGHVPA
jgi:hypothetical protein